MDQPLVINDETLLLERLDALLRQLHVLWCEEEGCPDGWRQAEADPEGAALQLSLALWEMAADGTAESAAALARLSAVIGADANLRTRA